MKRLGGALLWIAALVLVTGGFTSRASAQATVTNAEVLASNVGGLETGTTNTQFIFRANIAPAAGFGLIPNTIKVVIDPFDPATPSTGGSHTFLMTNKGGSLYVAYVTGASMGVGGHSWLIQARDTSGQTSAPFSWGASAAGSLRVSPASSPLTVTILPVDGNFQPDKRVTPGQLGNGLRIDPSDPTAPNDGGSAHFYTWRVKVTTTDGLPVQYTLRRGNYEWRDTRFDQSVPFIQRWNSGVHLVLIGPDGSKHYCPMEYDPDAPNNGISAASTHTVDASNPSSLMHPTGASVWSTNGVYFRYRMLPVQYMFNWGSLPGEGPVTSFGGPTQPDLTPALPIGMNIAGEVIGRPFNNQYAGFAGPDRTTPQGNFAPPFPFYTDTAGRAGQWQYYYDTTTDLRPAPRAGFNSNGDISTYPSDLYGADTGAYLAVYDSDSGAGVSSPSSPYQHPLVTPILSDGGWTDDLPENGFASGTGANSHRSRPTTKTRVRFQVRVTKGDNNPLPASAVRVFIDGAAKTMSQLNVPGNTDFILGIVYYYDATFPVGSEGQHYVYFEMDDGVHKAIWPRRDTPTQGTGDGRYFDVQAQLAPYANTYGTLVNFGTTTIGKNYLNEPLVNHKPVLSSPIVTPPSGTYGQPFTYEIVYQDADNDAPVDAWVVIDGQPHRMTLAPEDAGKSYTQGVRYRFVMTLNVTPDNKHTYYFKFRDNWNNMAPYGVSTIRREYGEWTTFPIGDENGVPASEITGPAISGNHPSELLEAAYFPGDPAHTPATLYDFTVKYRDEDNQAPANLKVFLSSDNGASWDGGHDLVKAENSTNFAAGVLYHLSARIKLPVGGPYLYRFQSTDNVQPSDTTLVHVGSRGSAVIDGTAHELKTVGGSTTIYGDPNLTAVNPSTKVIYDDPSTIYVWVKTSSTTTRLTYGTDFTLDAANGLITLAAAPTGRVYASYFYQNTVGPVITPNHAPTLSVPSVSDATTNQGTLTPLQGSPSTSFKYSIIYTDLDNQPPTFGTGTTGVNVVVDNNTTIQMTMDAATPTPVDYTKGVKFNASTSLQVGKHTYHFEASDGLDVARYPVQGADPTDLSGPTVTDPTNLVNPLIQTLPKSKSTDNYTFTVTYKNPLGNAPPNGGIEVRIKPVNSSTPITVGLTPIDPIGSTEFQNGVRYQVQLNANSVPPLGPGSYDVVFGFASNPQSGTAAIRFIVNGRPVIASPGVTPNPASQAGDVTLGVTYSDVNGDPPIRNGNRVIKLYIDGTEVTTVNPTTAGTDYKLGVLYQWTLQAKDLTVGDHTYYFTAQDDLEDANPFQVPAGVGGTFTIAAAQLPQLSEPGGDVSNNNGTLSPLSGSKTQVFTYSVVYKHGDGVAPVTMNLLVDPGTANARTVAMTTSGTPTPANFQSGVTYTATLNDLASGNHTYSFTATDRLAGTVAGHTVTLPASGTYSGPKVNFVPGLSLGTAFVAGSTTIPSVGSNNLLSPAVTGNVLSKYVFQVVYTDADGVAPNGSGFVKVKINNTQEIVLKPKPGDALNYAAGVVYSTEADSPGGVSLTAGQKAFHFEANDGLDAARYPTAAGSEISGLTVANIPVLAGVNPSGDDGTLSPRVGPLSTVFTYSVLYKNADNTAPAYVRVIIDGATFDMTKQTATSNNYAAGVVYQYTYRFAAGTNHNYRFIAGDTVSTGYVAKYLPDGSNIAGPTLNVPVFIAPTFNPSPGVVGQPITINSQLVASAPIGTAMALTLIRPDGSGFNATTSTDPATGNFSYVFTPDQTGDWKVRFSWGGATGTYDPLTTEFGFKVVGATLGVSGGIQDMISQPYIPVTPDPSITFNLTDVGGSPVSVTALNLVKWLPNAVSGAYFRLNFDTTFPGLSGGQGYWIQPSSSVVLNPKGKLYDQTQPYTVSLQAGWNMIGSVYLQDINWSAVKVRSAGVVMNIADAGTVVRPVAWGYNPATHAYEPVNVSDGKLRTWRGYWVRALQDCELILNIPGARSASISRDAIDKSNSIQVVARSGAHMETGNFVPLSAADKSRMVNLEKPPYVSDYVTVRFLADGKFDLPADSRAAAVGANVVGFAVDTDQKNADVTLQFPNASTVGRKTEVTVVDLSTGARRSVATNSGFTFNTGENAQSRKFAMIIRQVVGAERLVISGLQSDGGRGIDKGRYNISYNVTVAATMKAQIIGAAGQVVRDLDHGRAATRGVNALLWDGKDNKGVSVPAGSYTVKLSATDDKGNAANAVLPIVVVR